MSGGGTIWNLLSVNHNYDPFRSLAASENNELRYQAMIIWNKNVCRAEEERSVGGGGMFSRRLIEAGDLPMS